MTAIEKVLKIAEAEVGYLEKASNAQLDSKTANAGKKNFTKYARDIAQIPHFYNFDKNGFEWCTVFVDWCLIQAFGADLTEKMVGYPADSLGASCVWSVKYYKAIGRFSKTPQVGAQIFFGSNADNACHTGIVYKVDADKVYTIEGNTSGANGVVSNGGGVAKKSYARNYSQIVGYGMPKYELYKETLHTQEDTMVRYKTIEEMPSFYQAEAKELVELGFKGKGGTAGLDVTEDMLRTMIVNLRMCKALIAAVPNVDKAALFKEFKDNLNLSISVEVI